MNLTKEDIELVEKFIDIKNRGFYVDGRQLTEAYNRILNKRANVTQCGSCLRQRINELEAALNQFKRLSESKTEQEQTPDKVEENKAATDAGNEDIKARMAKVRAARGKKK